jgi:hypothetical protein
LQEKPLSAYTEYARSNVNGTKLRSWLRFLYQSKTNLLIPELVKIEAKRTLLILHHRKIEAKRILFIPQIRKIETERTLFCQQIRKIEAKRSLFIQELKKIKANELCLVIGKIKAKKTNWIEVRLHSSCYGAKESIPRNQFR